VRKAPLVSRVLLATASALLALTASEAALRVLERRAPGLGFLSPRPDAPPAVAGRPGVPFVLGVGESSMVGEPYDPKISLPGLVARELSRTYGVPIDARLAARKGAFLADLLPDLDRGLAGRPALVIVMAGHNDFLGRFGANRESGSRAMRLYAFLRPSRLLRLPLVRYLRNELLQPPDPSRRRLLDHAVAGDGYRSDIFETFSAAAHEAARRCRAAGVPAVVVSPASDEVEIEPSRSTFRGRPAERDRFVALFVQGREALEAGRPCAAEEALRQALGLDPSFAAASFRLGQALVAQGRSAEAVPFLRAARENDGFPYRMLDAQRAALADAARQSGHPFVDAEALLRASSSKGLLDASLFHDAHHPTLSGYLAIAREVAAAAARHDLLRLGVRPPLAPEPVGEVVRAFGFDAADGFELMRGRAYWLEAFGGMTFDPTDRLEFSARYLEGMRLGAPARWAADPSLAALEDRVVRALATSRARWRRDGAAGAGCLGSLPTAGPLPARWAGFPPLDPPPGPAPGAGGRIGPASRADR
jgi:tetratricopeptide (TPR) repeat protein